MVEYIKNIEEKAKEDIDINLDDYMSLRDCVLEHIINGEYLTLDQTEEKLDYYQSEFFDLIGNDYSIKISEHEHVDVILIKIKREETINQLI